MAELKSYDKLLQFPLFLGMGSDDLLQVIAHTRFEFIKLPAGKRLIKAGEACHHLHLLTNGKLKAETVSQDGAVRVEEEVDAPFIIQPESIMGINQRFTTTFSALADCHIIAINKGEVTKLSEQFLVFRLNLLGLFATRIQSQTRLRWQMPPASLRGHIVRFLRFRCIYPEGPKRFHILMQRLALEVNDSRTDVSRVLNEMQDEGLIQLGRGSITIHDIKELT